MNRILHFGLAGLLALVSGEAHARKPFELTVNVLDNTGFRDFSNLEDFLNALETEELNSIVSTYTNVSPADSILNIRGVPATATYTAGSPVLTFNIPSLGITEVFAGATRDESEELFEDWWEGEGGAALTRLLQEMVAKTPIDPVAGNPNSLMSQMVAADFSSASALGMGPGPGALSEVGGGGGVAAEAGQTRNLIGLEARFGRFTSGAFDTDVITLPLNYTYTLADPRWAVIFDLPLTYVDNSGASSYSGSFGVGLRVPFGDNWSLTPSARMGAVGSVDLGSAALIASGSVTSNYTFDFQNSTLSVANMLGYYKTFSVSAGDYDVKYDLTNYVSRNGLLFNQILPFDVMNQDTSIELAAVNTQFFGDELYVENFTELSATLGTFRRDGLIAWNALRLGFTYTFGENDYQGWRVSLGYRF
jgi:hypothetical protein